MNDPRTFVVGRRSMLGGSLAIMAIAAVGCSTQRTKPGSTSGGGKASGGPGGATNDGIFTVNFVGPTTQFYRNWNPFSPASNVGSGSHYFYEPLIRLDRFHAFAQKPWLAEKWEANNDYTEFTFQLRPDVTWSDGKPFTADDVVFTLMAPKTYANTKLVLTDIGVKKATKIDDHTVKVIMTDSSGANLNNVGTAAIYPQHIFAGQKLDKWLNPDPVGTGPFKVSEFSPQQVTLTTRDDYWGGKFTYLKQVKWAVFANEDAGKALVVQDKIDMATMSLQDAKATFEAKGKGNTYQVYSTGGGEALFYNCAKAPFSDVNVRRAVSKAIDFAKVMSLYQVDEGLGSVAGMAEAVWADYIAPEFQGKTIQPDPAAAKKALADGGWTVQGGNLTKNGKSYPITLKTVAEYTNWSTWADGIKQQLKDVLGIDVKVMKIPGDQYSTQEVKGQFDIAMDFGGGASRAADWFATGGSGMNKKDIVPLGQEASANIPRFSDDKASQILDKLATTFDENQIKPMVQDLQRIYVDQVPFFVYNTGGNFVELNGQKWTGLPDSSSKPDYAPVPYGGPDTVMMLQKLVPSGN